VKKSGTFRISSFPPLNRKDQLLVDPSDSAKQVGKFGMSPIFSQLLSLCVHRVIVLAFKRQHDDTKVTKKHKGWPHLEGVDELQVEMAVLAELPEVAVQRAGKQCRSDLQAPLVRQSHIVKRLNKEVPVTQP